MWTSPLLFLRGRLCWNWCRCTRNFVCISLAWFSIHKNSIRIYNYWLWLLLLLLALSRMVSFESCCNWLQFNWFHFFLRLLNRSNYFTIAEVHIIYLFLVTLTRWQTSLQIRFTHFILWLLRLLMCLTIAFFACGFTFVWIHFFLFFVVLLAIIFFCIVMRLLLCSGASILRWRCW